MSSETSVIVHAHICEDSARELLDEAIQRTGGDDRDRFVDLESNRRAGGHGGFGFHVFALCSRCLYLEEFLEEVAKIAWRYPEHLKIYIRKESDDGPAWCAR